MSEQMEAFKKQLKTNGLKVTTQRTAVIEALAKRPGEHLTVEQVFEIVRKSNPEIGLATVYRTLQSLSEIRLVEKFNLDDGYVRYEMRSECDELPGKHHHHHLICTECGRIMSFEGDLLEDLEKTIFCAMDFEVTDHEVKLYGRCSECRKHYHL